MCGIKTIEFMTMSAQKMVYETSYFKFHSYNKYNYLNVWTKSVLKK